MHNTRNACYGALTRIIQGHEDGFFNVNVKSEVGLSPLINDWRTQLPSKGKPKYVTRSINAGGPGPRWENAQGIVVVSEVHGSENRQNRLMSTNYPRSNILRKCATLELLSIVAFE